VQRIEKVNIEQIKQEVEPFVKDPASLALWSKDFFLDLASRIKLIQVAAWRADVDLTELRPRFKIPPS